METFLNFIVIFQNFGYVCVYFSLKEDYFLEKGPFWKKN